ncbi:hypothetical protein A5893_02995 [Pedobacter psychrophilus]|uniref:Uncharacterized protein n=2 Tax=Pedobacter psychrophilus TaxID=1826909 RepID=A0A179DM22_9SPHI|nr:hypothetical protein A5893_02995 [Pedobacter psychrophilus]
MRHFTNDNGKLYVYDKIENRFYESSTENLFVQKDRNTFKNLVGENDDFVEKIYSEYDSYFAGVLTEITTKKIFDGKILKSLISLAYLSKWRVRQYDESFKMLKIFSALMTLVLVLKMKMKKD